MAERSAYSTSWVDITNREHARLAASLQAEEKRRSRIEVLLMVVCIVAVSYTYPVNSLDQNPLIEITAISLQVPLRDAIILFPTIIASIYLVLVGSALRQSALLVRILATERALNDFTKTGETSPLGELPGFDMRAQLHQYLLLPSALHPRGAMWTPGNADIARLILVFFVGLVFSAVPYGAAVVITMRSYTLLSSMPVLLWNVACLGAMLLCLASAIVSLYRDQILHADH